MIVRKTLAEEDEKKQVQRLKHLAEGTPDLAGLAAALEHPTLTVRVEAARLLGEVGDADSLAHLKDALLSAYSGRSPKWHRVMGVLQTGGIFVVLTLLLGALVIALVMMCSCIVPAFGMGSPPSPFEMWDLLSEPKRKNDLFIRAVLEAMERLVEKHAVVELTPLIPALRTIAADSHHHRDLTRSAALNVISSIRALTYEVGELPISSQARPVDALELPIADER